MHVRRLSIGRWCGSSPSNAPLSSLPPSRPCSSGAAICHCGIPPPKDRFSCISCLSMSSLTAYYLQRFIRRLYFLSHRRRFPHCRQQNRVRGQNNTGNSSDAWEPTNWGENGNAENCMTSGLRCGTNRFLG
jgi:hypothetical protein